MVKVTAEKLQFGFALMKKLAIFLSLIVITGFGASCGTSSPESRGGLPDRDPELAYQLVEQEGALLLDVRTPGEFIASRLPGARNLPIEQLPQRINEIDQLLEGKKDHPIVVYCTVGSRAARAKRILVNAGYQNVSNLGGMSSWPRTR
jgi:phage shock protein E